MYILPAYIQEIVLLVGDCQSLQLHHREEHSQTAL